MAMKTIRIRQFPPSRCQEGSFRTITLTEGVKAVICRKEASGVLGPESGGEAPTVIGVFGCDAGLSDSGLSDRFVRFVDTEAAAAEWQLLHQIADRTFPAMRDVFLDAVEQTRDAVDSPAVERALVEALQTGDIERALRLIPWPQIGEAMLQTRWPPLIERVYAEAGHLSIRFLPRAQQGHTGAGEGWQAAAPAGISMDFDLTNPRAVAYLQQHSAALVQQISEETMRAVRQLMTKSFTAGVPPKQIAREIREVIGLTRSGAAAVTNFRRQLEEGTDWPAERVDKAVERYYQKTLRDRAETIARTETINASSAGQQELWLQARDRGHL